MLTILEDRSYMVHYNSGFFNLIIEKNILKRPRLDKECAFSHSWINFMYTHFNMFNYSYSFVNERWWVFYGIFSREHCPKKTCFFHCYIQAARGTHLTYPKCCSLTHIHPDTLALLPPPPIPDNSNSHTRRKNKRRNKITTPAVSFSLQVFASVEGGEGRKREREMVS